MNKSITKWLIVAIFILLIAYSGFATYNWLEGERIQNRTLNSAIDLSGLPLWELSKVGLVAESLTKLDTIDELFRERIIRYFFHVSTLHNSSSMLHALTNDEKYGLFGTAMINLQRFFVGVYDEPNGKEILTTNLDALKQMDDTLEEILRINDLTLADAEKLLQLSGNLTVG